jgi:hypothetical protein
LRLSLQPVCPALYSAAAGTSLRGCANDPRGVSVPRHSGTASAPTFRDMGWATERNRTKCRARPGAYSCHQCGKPGRFQPGKRVVSGGGGSRLSISKNKFTVPANGWFVFHLSFSKGDTKPG